MRAFTLDIRGEDEAARKLRMLGSRVGDARSFFRDVARLLMADHKMRFAQSPWVPLDADTIRQKVRAGQDPRVLRATHTLERALTVWGAPGQRLEIKPDELIFGLDQQGVAYYGVFHQKGQGVPKREVVKFERSTRRRILDALRDHLFPGR